MEVINKIDEIYRKYCAPSWFHLQDYIEMHGQQNIKKNQNKRIWCVLEDTEQQRVTQIRLHHEARDMRNVGGWDISDMYRCKSGN